MVEKIKFQNKMNKNIEVLVEPEAEYLDLSPGKTIVIELIKVSDKFNDEISLVLEDDMLIIYESRQCDMRNGWRIEILYYSRSYEDINYFLNASTPLSQVFLCCFKSSKGKLGTLYEKPDL